MRILHVASELHPYSKTGGLADMVGALARALAHEGHHVDVVTPLYRGILDKHPDIRRADWRFDLPIGPRWVSGEFWRTDPVSGLTIWFVGQDSYFDRKGIYNEQNKDYPDNAERFLFFTKAALLLARLQPASPAIAHFHDWQTALGPILIHHARATGTWLRAPRTILTIHNLAYQGWFPATEWALTNLPTDWFHLNSAEAYGQLNFLKAGLNLADALSTVSPRYAKEICTPEFGCGLEALLLRREYELTGILNGVEYAEWNTTANPALKHAYDVHHLAGKAANKADLQSELGLPVTADIPLFANITRLTDQKGADFQLESIDALLTAGESFQFALLGGGDPKLEAAYRALMAAHPGKVVARIGFDPLLAHRIEAGADFYLMPSRFEPCGLNQLYSLRYGTIPVVRATGGLDDSVIDIRENPNDATGIKFTETTAAALSQAIRKALALFREPQLFAHFRRNGMTADFSWSKQAREYRSLYDHLLHGV
jgi:starch synthase